MMPACGQGAVAGEEGADQQRVDRQPGAAAHERGDEDRGQAVLAVLDGARGHDAGDGAGEAAKQRDEALAVQADLGQQAVHQEGGPGEVAAVFEDREEEEEHRDLRDEDDDRADAFEDAVGEQRLERAFGHAAGDAGRRGQSMPFWMASMIGWASQKMETNSPPMMTAKMSRPQTLWMRIASSFCVKVRSGRAGASCGRTCAGSPVAETAISAGGLATLLATVSIQR